MKYLFIALLAMSVSVSAKEDLTNYENGVLAGMTVGITCTNTRIKKASHALDIKGINGRAQLTGIMSALDSEKTIMSIVSVCWKRFNELGE